VEIVEAPLESKTATRVHQYALQFLTNTPPARIPDEVLLGRPYHDKKDHKVCFRGNDIIRYLEINGMKVEPRKIWISLREAGAEHGALKLKNSVVQVWKIPELSVPSVSLDLPEDEDESF
jgi:hypothetical protein